LAFLLLAPAPALCADAAPLTGPWAFMALALLLVGGLAFLLGGLLAQRNSSSALSSARDELQRRVALDDRWCWRTNARHELQRCQAPAAHALDTEQETLRQLFANHTELRARLRDERSFAGLRVHPLEAEAGGQWLLSGTPLLDDGGRFAGFMGWARPCETAPAPPAAAAADEGDTFGFTLSHDLRAPVRVVEGFTRIVKEDYGRLLDRVGNDHLDRVLSAAARMNAMIDALMTLARLSQQPLALQPVNLSQLAAFVMDDLKRAAPERQADVNIEPGLVTQGDPTLLRLVLENLLGNAWKYTGRAARAHIVFARGAQDGRTSFVVRDNGAGFDMRSADRLFGLFQRLHGSNDFPGTGVGLASVKRIVRRHGGDIWAEAEPGRGAAFYFTLGT
jgi:signal transduction histidine kinase